MSLAGLPDLALSLERVIAASSRPTLDPSQLFEVFLNVFRV